MAYNGINNALNNGNALGQASAMMKNAAALSSGLAADAQSLSKLKYEAGKNTPASVREAAKQFESLFMRELLKSMREATMKTGMLDSPGGDLGMDMLDQQYAVQMSGQPGGLSDLIEKQLLRQMGITDPTTGARVIGPDSSPTRKDPSRNVGPVPGIPIKPLQPFQPLQPLQPLQPSTPAQPLSSSTLEKYRGPSQAQVNFVNQHSAVAKQVAQASGIPVDYMLGQAGHETGWGKFEIQHKDGTPSHNLFGIKATAGWTGKVAEVSTTEYVNGSPQKTVARFRAYDSYAESFQDYARLISTAPRYAQAKQSTSAQDFATGLQKAGYATDPNYATKLGNAIASTQQLRRVQT